MARQFIYHMQGLTKTYPGGKKVLENINLSFYPDAKIGVLGVNGAGKSMLLRIMAGRMDFRISRCALRYLHIDRTVCHDPLPGGLLQRPGQHCNGNRFYLSRPLLRALVNRDVVAPRRPNVELARTPNLLTRILDHFLPLRDPAGGARHRE